MVAAQYRRMVTKFKQIFSARPHHPPYHHVCQIGDPVLRQKCEYIPIEEIQTPFIEMIILAMKKTMKDYNVVGLSAPQIGIPLKIMMFHVSKSFVDKAMDQDEKKANALGLREIPHTTIINPELLVKKRAELVQVESCASIKGYSALVPRASEVTVNGYNEDAKPISVTGEGLLARILQHEVDHLAGRLFIDIMDPQTFQNDGWQAINRARGNMHIFFTPEKL